MAVHRALHVAEIEPVLLGAHDALNRDRVRHLHPAAEADAPSVVAQSFSVSRPGLIDEGHSVVLPSATERPHCHLQLRP
jgi:hypothetical protein